MLRDRLQDRSGGNSYFVNEFQAKREVVTDIEDFKMASWCTVLLYRITCIIMGRRFILFITEIDNVRCLWISDDTIKETYLVDCVIFVIFYHWTFLKNYFSPNIFNLDIKENNL